MKKYIITGFLGPIIAFSGIIAAAVINRDWWSITDNAISDMGHVGLPYNYVLNISLIIAGILTFHSTWFLKDRMKSHVSKGGFYFFMFAIACLALIGVFPEGTKLHGPVSYTFFYGGTIALLIVGSGIFFEGEKKIGATMIGIILVEIALAEWAQFAFKGVAISEIIAALGIVSSYYLTIYTRGIKEQN